MRGRGRRGRGAGRIDANIGVLRLETVGSRSGRMRLARERGPKGGRSKGSAAPMATPALRVGGGHQGRAGVVLWVHRSAGLGVGIAQWGSPTGWCQLGIVQWVVRSEDPVVELHGISNGCVRVSRRSATSGVRAGSQEFPSIPAVAQRRDRILGGGYWGDGAMTKLANPGVRATRILRPRIGQFGDPGAIWGTRPQLEDFVAGTHDWRGGDAKFGQGLARRAR